MLDSRLRGNDGGESGNDGQGLRINMLMRKPGAAHKCGQLHSLPQSSLGILLI